eukprot:scaffold1541_cov144-Alexandrium_tamarense.AAC.2
MAWFVVVGRSEDFSIVAIKEGLVLGGEWQRPWRWWCMAWLVVVAASEDFLIVAIVADLVS